MVGHVSHVPIVYDVHNKIFWNCGNISNLEEASYAISFSQSDTNNEMVRSIINPEFV